MDEKQIRRRCEARLRALDLPTPFDVRSFCHALGVQRGRRIELHPLAGTEGACGVWVAMASADLIFYDEGTTPLHQEHIILHEVSHVLCGHQPPPVSHQEEVGLLVPSVHPEVVRRVMQRTRYSTEEEREAELLASLMLERAARSPAHRTRPAGRDRVVERLEVSLDVERSRADW